MKAVICLASLAILAGVVTAAPFAWDPNTLYTYRVRSRFDAGMLGLEGPAVADTETMRAVVELTWFVDVQLSNSQPNEIFMNPREFTAVITKERIHPREDPLTTREEVAIPPKALHLLEKIMKVKLDPKSGVPEGIYVWTSESLTTNQRNIKRAQVNAFILNPGTAKLVVKGNLNRQTNSVRLSEMADDSGFFYKVLEESIHGECQAYYTVSQTGPFQSLYNLEAQDVPVRKGEQSNDQSSDSYEAPQFQHKTHPRFAHTHQNADSSENEINENGQQQPWPQAYKEFCNEGDLIFVVRKTVNLTACRDRPVLSFMMPPELLHCRPGDNSCGSQWNHVVFTRFLACGKSRQDFTIIEINQEERFVYGSRTEENIDGYAVKNVTLLEKQRISSGSGIESQVKQDGAKWDSFGLVFQFDIKTQQDQFTGHQQQQRPWQNQYSGHHQTSGSGESVYENNGPVRFPLQHQLPGLHSPPLLPQLITDIVNPEQLIERAEYLVENSGKNMLNPKKSIVEGETIAVLALLAKTIRFMNKPQILELYGKVLDKYSDDHEMQATVKIQLCDSIVAAGTNPALVAMMELIESGKVTGEPARQLVMTFAHYSRYPTEEFLSRFEEFIKSSLVQNDKGLRTTARLAYSTLLHRSCVDARTKQTMYPYALYGPFCKVEYARKFVRETVAKLDKVLSLSKKQLKQSTGKNKDHEVSLYLTSLALVGLPEKEFFDRIQQILDESEDIQEKSKAILALKPFIRSHEEDTPPRNDNGHIDTQQSQNEVDRVEMDPVTDDVVEKKLLPLLMSVAFDRTEHPVVRIAAIQMLLYCTYADVTVWQQLAMSTWFEPSEDVHQFIYTSIDSLAKLPNSQNRIHQRMIVNARSVFPLLKPLDDQTVSKSTNTFASGTVPHLNAGFFRQFTWFGTRDSRWPTSVYYRSYNSFGSGAIGVNPLEFSLNFRSLPTLIDEAYDKFTSSDSDESGEKNAHMQKLLAKIEKREMKDPAHGSVLLSYRGMTRLWEIENLDEYLQWKHLSSYVSMSHPTPFNYGKTIQLAHQTMEFPSILGYPMTFKLRLSMLTSLRGKVALNGDHQDYQFHAQVDAVAGMKRHVKISLKIPYLQRKIESGIQSHFVVQTPFRFTARARSDEPIVVAVTPTLAINETSPTGKIELFTFHRKPYVAIINDELYPTVFTKGGEMTTIRTIERPTVSENHAENVLGFSVSTREESDYRPEKESPSAWARFLGSFRSVETFLNLGQFGGKTGKYATRKVYLNVDESRSSTLIFMIAAKRGSGSLAQGFDTDVSSSSSSSSSSEESNESNSSNSSDDNNNQSSSSSSSSSETNEASNSNENSQEVLKNGRTFVLAVVTKEEPVPPVARTSSGVIRLIQSKYPNQKQYILQLSKRSDKFFFRFAQGAAAEDAARSLQSINSNSIEILAKAIIDPNYQGQQIEFCTEVDAQIVYPKYVHPRLLITRRNNLLNQDLKVDVQGQILFAHTCKDADLQHNYIKLNGELYRGRNMTEWARTASPEAQQCQEDENKGFSVSDDCLTVAYEQAAALNRARFNIQWSSNLPRPLQQTVYIARDIAKYTFMPHVYHDRFPQNRANGNSLIADLDITPDTKYWSINVLTNTTELKIRNVPSHSLIQAALPLSALQPIEQNVLDNVFGIESQLTCQLEGQYISSFDNVVGRIDTNVAQQCYHLLTGDGSGDSTMAFYAKNIGTDNLKLLLILPQTKIILTPTRGVPRSRLAQVELASDIVATVNGQTVSLPYTVRKQNQRSESNDYVARIQPLPSGGVQVLTPKNHIAFDGSKLIIFGDDSFRNKTIGMCGDCDGEKVADRRSRKDIPLSNPTLLYADYAFDPENEQKCNVNPEIKQQIVEEQSLAYVNRGRDGGNHISNLRWGQALFSRAQQRSAWQGRPYHTPQGYQGEYQYQPQFHARG